MRPTVYRWTGIVFYVLVSIWVLGIVLGFALHWPYVRRSYGGITLVIWDGVILAALTIGNLWSGAIWRGSRHSAIDRELQPRAFWIILGGMAALAAVLLGIGINHWLTLTG